ncbi:MAG: hypothetical protein ABR574_09825 [Cryomorphaceae bacterium]
MEYTEDTQPKIFYLAMRVERGKTDRDLKILSVERELMDQENNILPTPQDGEEVFELEFLDRSRQKIGGQTIKTSFKYGEEDAPQAIVKFGTTVPNGAVFARVSFRVNSDVLREIAVYEIVKD